MAGLSSDSRVRDLFADGTRVWTPAAAQGAVQVLYTPCWSDTEMTRRCAEVLSDVERLKAGCFVAAQDRALFIQRRAFRRYCGGLALGTQSPLSQIHFATTPNGRPFLADRPDVWFSFSSCRRGMLAAWSLTHAVGVDIEDLTKTVEAIEVADAFFTPAEAKIVGSTRGTERPQRFFRLWSLKEAALKSIGEGLSFSLDTFSFDLEPQPRVANAPLDRGGHKNFSPHLVEEHECCAAVVIRSLGRGNVVPSSACSSAQTRPRADMPTASPRPARCAIATRHGGRHGGKVNRFHPRASAA